MASIDDLPAEQQAVLRLLLTQEHSYEQIARTLRMAPAAVRDRAHEAVATLGPSGTALAGERRAEIADFLLGQQDEQTAARTRTALSESASERGWARVVAAELRTVATRELPAVPDPASGDASGVLLDDDPAPGSESAAARLRRPARSSRRGGAILLSALALLAALAIGFFVGRWTEDDPAPAPAQTNSAQAAARDVIGQANLEPVPDAGVEKAIGIAQFIERDGKRTISVLAEGLPRAPKDSGYGVWLTGSGKAPLWLGYFQAVTTSGQVGAQSALKVDPRQYKTVLITRESGRNPSTPGSSYLSGEIKFRSG